MNYLSTVVPAQAGTHHEQWIPACAGMTVQSLFRIFSPFATPSQSKGAYGENAKTYMEALIRGRETVIPQSRFVEGIESIKHPVDSSVVGQWVVNYLGGP